MPEFVPTETKYKKHKHDERCTSDGRTKDVVDAIDFQCFSENSNALADLTLKNKELFDQYLASKSRVAESWDNLETAQCTLSQTRIDFELALLVLCYNLKIIAAPLLSSQNDLLDTYQIPVELLDSIENFFEFENIKNHVILFLSTLSKSIAKLNELYAPNSNTDVSALRQPDVIMENLNQAKTRVGEAQADRQSNLDFHTELLERHYAEYQIAMSEFSFFQRRLFRLSTFKENYVSNVGGELPSRDGFEVTSVKPAERSEVEQSRKAVKLIEDEISKSQNEKFVIAQQFADLKAQMTDDSEVVGMSTRSYLEYDLKLVKARQIALDVSIQNRTKLCKSVMENRKKNVKNIEVFYKKKIKDLKSHQSRSEEKLKRMRSEKMAANVKYESMENSTRFAEWMKIYYTHQCNQLLLNALSSFFEAIENPEYVEILDQITVFERIIDLLETDSLHVQQKYPILSFDDDVSVLENIQKISVKLDDHRKAYLSKTTSETSLMDLVRDTYASESLRQNNKLAEQYAVVYTQALKFAEKQNELQLLKRAASHSRRLNQILATEAQMSKQKNIKLLELQEIEQQFTKKLEKYNAKLADQVAQMGSILSNLGDVAKNSALMTNVLTQYLHGIVDELGRLKGEFVEVYRRFNDECDSNRASKIRVNKDKEKMQENTGDALLENYRRCFNCSLCSRANPVDCMIVLCRHVFCFSCIDEKCIKTRSRKCPLCNVKFDKSNVIKLEFS